MSDTSRGAGWWLASDGKWYPPEQHPGQPPTGAVPPPFAPGSAAGPPGPGWWMASDARWYPPQPGYPPTAPKKTDYKLVWIWVGVAVVVASIFGISSVVIFDKLITKVTSTQTVVYTVTGYGTPTITYSSYGDSFRGNTQLKNVALPWTLTTSGPAIFGNSYSVTAVLGSTGGQLSCSLSVNGIRVSTRNANGPFASVTCTDASS